MLAKLVKTATVGLGAAVVFLGGAGPAAADLCVGSLGVSGVLRYEEATGTPSGFCAAGGGLVDARGLTFGSDGNLYVSDTATNRVLRYDGDTGAFIDVFVPSGSGGLFEPQGLTFGPDGDLYVVSFISVLRYDGATGAFIGVFASPVIGAPTDLVFGPDGNLYVATIVQVQRFDGATGQFLDVFASGGTGSALFALAFGPDGNLYVSDNLGNEVAKFDGDTGARLAGFRECGSPLGLAFGPDGLLYVSCGRASIVRLDPTTGAVVDTFVAPGNGGLTVPLYMAFAPSATGVEERLAELLDSVIGVGPGTSLADKVEAAQAMYAQGDEAGTCEILGALIKQVEAQSGQQIPATKANALITDATAIREEIGC